MAKCGALFIKMPVCPFSKRVNGQHTNTHTCNKEVSPDDNQRGRVWHKDRDRLAVCKCGVDSSR